MSDFVNKIYLKVSALFKLVVQQAYQEIWVRFYGAFSAKFIQIHKNLRHVVNSHFYTGFIWLIITTTSTFIPCSAKACQKLLSLLFAISK